MTSKSFLIRKAKREDTPLILQFIKELAEYEKLSGMVVATEERLADTLFGDCTYAEVLLGFEGEEPAAFALFFHNYSTFLGQPGIYLEDLFVRPAFRRKGYGRVILSHLAKIAVSRNCGRLEWAVLDWNSPAIDFYRSLGALSLDEWTTFRLTGADLAELAEREVTSV